MNLNDWDFVWRRQELPVGPEADIAQLRQSYEAKSRKQARALLVRDLTEASASAFLAIGLSKEAMHAKSAWLVWLAVAILLTIGGVFVRERLRARRLRLDSSAPLLTKLEADLAELRHQHRLISRVGVWYFGPLAFVMVLVGAAKVMNLTATEQLMLEDPFTLACLGGYLALCLILFIGGYAINRRAVRKRIEPRIAELEKLQHELMSQKIS